MNRRPEKNSIGSSDAYFSVVVSQRLFECIGLFILPSLTRLRFLDCVEVQRSARHLEDCHTRFYKENRMHLICAPGSFTHT
jgi:hypothetical protein